MDPVKCLEVGNILVPRISAGRKRLYFNLGSCMLGASVCAHVHSGVGGWE